MDPSPWPVVSSIAVLILALGSIQYVHDGEPWLMLLDFAAVLYAMVVWWRDVIIEANQGDHTPVVQLHQALCSSEPPSLTRP